MRPRAVPRPCIVTFLLVLLAPGLAFVSVPGTAHPDPVPFHIEEIVTDPQTDWDGSGSVTTSDEYVVLYNPGDAALDVAGWTLHFEDGTPTTEELTGQVPAAGRLWVLNPSGAINNDAQVTLVDAAGIVVDSVALGTGDIPDGNAAGRADEAVYTHGPWRGLRSEGSGGAGLPPVVVRALSSDAGPMNDGAEAFWVAARPSMLDLWFDVAPGIGTVRLYAGSDLLPMQEVAPGHRRVGSWHPEGASVSFTLVADGAPVTTWPSGALLTAQVDPAPPVVSTSTLIQNATGHLIGPLAGSDADSGIETWSAQYGGPSGDPVPGCALPVASAASCPAAATETLHVVVQDRAGWATAVDLRVASDVHPPPVPTDIGFHPQVPPRLEWPTLDADVANLRIQTRTGSNVETHVLDANATGFVDAAYDPGSARAYRLIVQDAARNENRSTWFTLPPEAVPVQCAPEPAAGIVDHLLEHGALELQVSCDRPLDALPSLRLTTPDVDRSWPPRPTTSNQSFRFDLELPLGLRLEGNGTWALEGANGTDGAPLATAVIADRWDRLAPRVTLRGTSDTWTPTATTSLAVLVEDAHPEVWLNATGAVARSVGSGHLLHVSGAGAHEITLHVTDGAGNRNTTQHLVRLDPDPPILALAGDPDGTVLRFDAQDAQSGLDRARTDASFDDGTGRRPLTVRWDGGALVVDLGAAAAEHGLATVSVADHAGHRTIVDVRIGSGLPSAAAARVIHAPTPSPSDDATAPARGPETGSVGAPRVQHATMEFDNLSASPDVPVDGDTARAPLIVGLVGASVIGLGTVVRRRTGRKSAAQTDSEDDADTKPEDPGAGPPGPTGHGPAP